jgi:hypothetical protein
MRRRDIGERAEDGFEAAGLFFSQSRSMAFTCFLCSCSWSRTGRTGMIGNWRSSA